MHTAQACPSCHGGAFVWWDGSCSYAPVTCSKAPLLLNQLGWVFILTQHRCTGPCQSTYFQVLVCVPTAP